MTRRIRGLISAAKLTTKPACIPTSRARGVKALGVRYEREVAKALPVAEAGAWWEFRDRNGPGYCQTDLLVLGERFVLVLEAKYTYTVDAWRQLLGLYQPVVELALGLPVIPVQVCRVLTPNARNVTTGLAEAIELAKAEGWATLHWVGGKPLWPVFRGATTPHIPAATRGQIAA
jgi:hypothetical protein